MPNVNELERIEEDVEDVDTVSVTEDLIGDSVSHDLLVEFTDSKAPDIRGSNGFREFIEEPSPLGKLYAESTSNLRGALDKQVSGNHYKKFAIQPIEFTVKNNLDFLQGNVIKYTCRHKDKNGVDDINKAIHYLELIKEYDYNG